MGTKGALTRQNILQHAMKLASQLGLEGLSIGRLAEQLALSKSGLFAHFRSKEALQMQVLDVAASEFIGRVVKPAVAEPRGEKRVRALFENWLRWDSDEALPGGCIFIAASAELDDRPGPVRDHLVKLQEDWQQTRRRIVHSGVQSGDFPGNLDVDQVAYELFGILMAYHHSQRLLRDPKADKRARKAFETLLASIRASSSGGKK